MRASELQSLCVALKTIAHAVIDQYQCSLIVIFNLRVLIEVLGRFFEVFLSLCFKIIPQFVIRSEARDGPGSEQDFSVKDD